VVVYWDLPEKAVAVVAVHLAANLAALRLKAASPLFNICLLVARLSVSSDGSR
jgi:hypothetical protein